MYKLFSAEWCTHCSNLKKQIELLGEVVTVVDIDIEPEEPRALGVKGIPCLYDTETGAMLVGNITAEQLKAFIS